MFPSHALNSSKRNLETIFLRSFHCFKVAGKGICIFIFDVGHETVYFYIYNTISFYLKHIYHLVEPDGDDVFSDKVITPTLIHYQFSLRIRYRSNSWVSRKVVPDIQQPSRAFSITTLVLKYSFYAKQSSCVVQTVTQYKLASPHGTCNYIDQY